MGRVSTRLLAMAPGTGGRMAGLVGLLLAVTATHVGQGVLIARVLAAVFAGDPPASVLAEQGGSSPSSWPGRGCWPYGTPGRWRCPGR